MSNPKSHYELRSILITPEEMREIRRILSKPLPIPSPTALHELIVDPTGPWFARCVQLNGPAIPRSVPEKVPFPIVDVFGLRPKALLAVVPPPEALGD